MGSPTALNKCLLFYFLIIFYWLFYYSCPDFSHFAHFHPSTHHSFKQFLHDCSCPWVMHISSLASPFPVLYFTSPWLFVLLDPLTSSPFPYTPFPSGNHPNALCIHESVSVLLVCLLCFLDLVVDRYVFIAILLCIVLILLFFLNKPL